MIRHALSLLMTLSLASAALAEDLNYTVLARGDDGAAEAKLVELETAETLARAYPGLELAEGSSAAAIHLGEQPEGVELSVARVRSADRFGWSVEIRLQAQAPAVSKRSVRPYLVVAFPKALEVKYAVRVQLRLGDATLGPMSLDQADRTRAALAVLDRRQRCHVAELSQATAAKRAQVYALEREIANTMDDPAYRAASRALPWKQGIRRAVDEAAFRTDLQLFGTTLNPLWTSGDENLKYLPKQAKRAQQTAAIESGYAEEDARLEAKLDELRQRLQSMQDFAAAHLANDDGAGEGAGAADVIASSGER